MRTEIVLPAVLDRVIAEQRRINADAVRLGVDPPYCVEYVGDQAFTVSDPVRVRAYTSAAYAELERAKAARQ